MIHVENLNYEPLFSNLNLDIKEGSFCSLLGRNGVGKSTLIKMILGLTECDGTITINGLSHNKKKIRKHIGVVFQDADTNFVSETAREDMIDFLRNLGWKENEIHARIDEVGEQLHISELLDYSISNLSGGEKQILAFAIAILHKPFLLILDDPFSMLDGIQKEKMLKYLKKMNREEKTTILFITNDMDDTLYGSEVAVMDDNKIILQGKKEDVFKEEKVFQKAGLELPFMASLSLKLKFYDLIDTMILDMDKMVNVLWK